MTDYKITRRDPSKVYPKLPKILVGDNEETLVIYGDIDMTDYSELIRKARAVPGPTLLMTYPAQTTPDPLSNALADAIEDQAREISVLRSVLTDCADALEAWVDDLYARGSLPGGYREKYERDLAAVDAARAALKGEK